MALVLTVQEILATLPESHALQPPTRADQAAADQLQREQETQRKRGGGEEVHN